MCILFLILSFWLDFCDKNKETKPNSYSGSANLTDFLLWKSRIYSVQLFDDDFHFIIITSIIISIIIIASTTIISTTIIIITCYYCNTVIFSLSLYWTDLWLTFYYVSGFHYTCVIKTGKLNQIHLLICSFCFFPSLPIREKQGCQEHLVCQARKEIKGKR